MTNESSLKNRVMARIYLEYAKNIFTEYVDYIMFVLFVSVSLALISIRHVLENIPKDNILSLLNFFVVALKNTSFVIQAMVAGFFVRVSTVSILSTYRNAKNLDAARWLSKLKLSNTEKSSL